MPRRRTGPLSKTEMAAWRALLRALTVVPRVVEADLMTTSRLNMADYSVLSHLSEQPTRSMRMSELAARATLSPSGITRVVERLERQGAVERDRTASDGRVQIARLTDAGLRRLEEAYPDHVESVRRRVLDHLGGLDLVALADALNAIGEDER